MKRKPRAVIDSNLFISDLFGKKDAIPTQLQDLWISQEFELATSKEIMKEVSRLLQYPIHGIKILDAKTFLYLLKG